MLPLLEERYERTHKALAILETALMSITRRRAEYGPNFHFDAVQWVEEILKVRAQIDEIIGLTAFLKEFGPPPTSDTPISPTSKTAQADPLSPTAKPLPAAG
jgi:hypothetical protein